MNPVEVRITSVDVEGSVVAVHSENVVTHSRVVEGGTAKLVEVPCSVLHARFGVLLTDVYLSKGRFDTYLMPVFIYFIQFSSAGIARRRIRSGPVAVT